MFWFMIPIGLVLGLFVLSAAFTIAVAWLQKLSQTPMVPKTQDEPYRDASWRYPGLG